MSYKTLWGEFTKDEDDETKQIVPVSAKRMKLNEIKYLLPKGPEKKCIQLKIKNPLVTQTIEVMKQTEMMKSLIETYSNQSSSPSDFIDPCQMVPEVNFPPENAADFVTNDEKFVKPVFFNSIKDTRFARGLPRHYPQINGQVGNALLRKAVCAQLRMTGYTDAHESAIALLTDSAEDFARNLMREIRQVHNLNPEKATERNVDIETFEKAYFGLTSKSLVHMHNYFRQVIGRNRCEIAEFNEVRQEYNKLITHNLENIKQETPDEVSGTKVSTMQQTDMNDQMMDCDIKEEQFE